MSLMLSSAEADWKANHTLCHPLLWHQHLLWLARTLLSRCCHMCCRLQKVTSLDRIGSKVLSPSNQSGNLVKSGTPGSGSGSALKTPRLDAGSAEGPRKQVTFGTDSEAGMQFSPAGAMTGSVLKKKSKRLQKVTQSTCLTNESQQVSDKTCWKVCCCLLCSMLLCQAGEWVGGWNRRS